MYKSRFSSTLGFYSTSASFYMSPQRLTFLVSYFYSGWDKSFSGFDIFLERRLLSTFFWGISIDQISLLRSIFLSMCFFLNMNLLQTLMLQLTITTDFLDAIDPPSSYPPSQEQLNSQLENKFIQECQKFISNERLLYKCSKSIETRLKNILESSDSIKDNLATHKNKFDHIQLQLAKYKEQKQQLKERENVLKMLCQLIQMEELRKDLLIGGDKIGKENQFRGVLGHEEGYLSNLEKLDLIIAETDTLSNFGQQYPLIKDIIAELQSIFNTALSLLIKELLTPSMVDLTLNKFAHIFFKECKSRGVFQQAIIKNRTQHIKICLNPMINSLNYASNIPQLYHSILTNWIELLKKEVQLLAHSKQFHILKVTNTQLLGELIPKMEKNMFRIKDLVQIVKIRKYFSDFGEELQKIQQLKSTQEVQEKDKEKSKQKEKEFQSPILSLTNKAEVMIESMMAQESESLQSSKYNIYTLVSYIPIREHLQKIKVCYEHSISREQIDWQVGFYNLFSSRDPKNYPNNKSLVIFNLNIWYLYLKVVGNGKYKKEGEEVLNWCKNTFTNINFTQAKRAYEVSFQKILQIGGNTTAFMNTLYAQIQLLGHQELRRDLANSIREKYIEAYPSVLKKFEKQPMTNEEVKKFCQEKKINLNKFGKLSQSVCIPSPEELRQLLEYH